MGRGQGPGLFLLTVVIFCDGQCPTHDRCTVNTGWMNRWMQRSMDEWVNGWNNGWIDEIVRNL